MLLEKKAGAAPVRFLRIYRVYSVEIHVAEE